MSIPSPGLDQILWIVFALLVGALFLPLSHGVRWGVFLILIAFVVVTLLSGGMAYLIDIVE